MSKFVKYTTYTIGVILNLVVFCLVMSQLWTWFVFPLGLPAVGAVHVYGLFLMILLTKTRNMKRALKPEFYTKGNFGLSISMGILFSLTALLFGWLAVIFM